MAERLHPHQGHRRPQHASPTVSGTPQVGKKLRPPTASGARPTSSSSYQWLANGKPIAGATAKDVQATAAQLGKRLRAKVTATKSGSHTGSAAPSPPTDRSPRASSPTPRSRRSRDAAGRRAAERPAPRHLVSGGARTATSWFAGGTRSTAPRRPTFTPTADQLGKPIKVGSTLEARGYTTNARQVRRTHRRRPRTVQRHTAPTISGTAQVDRSLTAIPGTWIADRQGPPAVAGRRQADRRRHRLDVQAVTPPTSARTSRSRSPSTEAGTTTRWPARRRRSGRARHVPQHPRAPTIVGTAQVGVPLTRRPRVPGHRRPRSPTSGSSAVAEVPGATSSTFTPRPQDIGKPVEVEVLASRHGLPDRVGRRARRRPPTLRGMYPLDPGTRWSPATPMVGHTLAPSDRLAGRSTAVTLSYQWYAGRRRSPAPRSATYSRPPAEAGHPIHVVVTAKSRGVHLSGPRGSTATDPVLLGRVILAKPTVPRQGGPRCHADRPTCESLAADGRHAALPVVPRGTTRSPARTTRRTTCRRPTSATASTSSGDGGRARTGSRGPKVAPRRPTTSGPSPRLHVRTSIRYGPRLPQAAVSALGLDRTRRLRTREAGVHQRSSAASRSSTGTAAGCSRKLRPARTP